VADIFMVFIHELSVGSRCQPVATAIPLHDADGQLASRLQLAKEHLKISISIRGHKGRWECKAGSRPRKTGNSSGRRWT
jgi:hypothetical protein